MEIVTTLLDGYHSFAQKEKLMILFAIICAIFVLYRLARSEEVDESGRVIVTYHSPLTWLRRFNDQVDQNRAEYSEKNKSFLSFLWKGSKILQSVPPLLMSIILFLIAYVSYGEANFWYYLGAGFVCLCLFFWFLPKLGEDPYKNQ